MNRDYFLQAGNIFEGRQATGERQDKQPPERLTAGSREPATVSPVAVGSKEGRATARVPAVDRHEHKREATPAVDRQTHHGSEKRQTTQVTGRVPHHIKTKLLEKAEANGWTESKAVAEACAVYVEQDLAEQFGVKLAARVTEAIDRGLAKHSNREAYLTVQGYYATEQARIINTKVLSYLFGSDTQIYKQIVEDARKEARVNLKRQLEEK